MKIKVIELSKIDELLREYEEMKNEGETLSEFIEVSKCDNEDGTFTFDWNYVEEEKLEEVIEDEN
jgi:hypothetical protein